MLKKFLAVGAVAGIAGFGLATPAQAGPWPPSHINTSSQNDNVLVCGNSVIGDITLGLITLGPLTNGGNDATDCSFKAVQN
ncbi:hypothetical protein AB0K60_34110 [Thermopolyspora sp. NPDC052614]|uniref:hypothetical protein n=1 Tax=Thermopolyspora sp. NPDC052614 TaxID=3155682 RepID=UPI00341993AD